MFLETMPDPCLPVGIMAEISHGINKRYAHSRKIGMYKHQNKAIFSRR